MRQRAFLPAVIAAALAATLALGSSVQAATKPAPDLFAEREAITAFQAKDQVLQDIGWKLAHGNAEFCDNVIASAGLQLQDLASYGEPNIARTVLGLNGDFAVQTAARSSPAWRAGITPNREIAKLAGESPDAWPAKDKRDWRRLTRAHDFIDTVLRDAGEISVEFAGGEVVVLPAQNACATRFELAGRGAKAVADGKRVVIGAGFVGFGYREEIFAGAIAHELAHNLLSHRVWLDRNTRGRKNVRQTEREADRLMPWLMANAGYDPRAAVEFMETWGPGHDGGLFRSRTHDGWDERVEFIAAELPQISSLMKNTGKADWRVHFRREIDPNKGL